MADAITRAVAYAMGFDAAAKGPDTTNCNFRIFARPDLTQAWESGNAAGKIAALASQERK